MTYRISLILLTIMSTIIFGKNLNQFKNSEYKRTTSIQGFGKSPVNLQLTQGKNCFGSWHSTLNTNSGGTSLKGEGKIRVSTKGLMPMATLPKNKDFKGQFLDLGLNFRAEFNEINQLGALIGKVFIGDVKNPSVIFGLVGTKDILATINIIPPSRDKNNKPLKFSANITGPVNLSSIKEDEISITLPTVLKSLERVSSIIKKGSSKSKFFSENLEVNKDYLCPSKTLIPLEVNLKDFNQMISLSKINPATLSKLKDKLQK